MFSQVIYASNAIDGLSESDLQHILLASQRNNAAVGLSGMLLYGHGHFIQALEGPAEGLEQMMARIGADGRHTRVRVLLSRSIEARDFAGWSMGFRRLTESDWHNHPAVNRFLEEPLDLSHFKAFGSPARFMLQAFRDMSACQGPGAHCNL
jgi:hypothetical protein